MASFEGNIGHRGSLERLLGYEKTLRTAVTWAAPDRSGGPAAVQPIWTDDQKTCTTSTLLAFAPA